MKIALVCIAKNEDRYIDEWIKYHLKLGFRDVFIYKNNWNYTNNKKNVYVVPFNGEQRQFPAYNHWLESYSHLYDWVAFLDVDEFICLKKHNTVNHFLSDYNDCNGLALNWVMFTQKINGDGVNPEDDGAIKRFFYREQRDNHHCKFLINLNLCKSVIIDSPHFPRNCCIVDTHRRPCYNMPFNESLNTDIAQINHYYYKTYNEFVKKCLNGRADCVGIRPLEYWGHQSTDVVKDMIAYNFMYGERV